MALGNGLSFPVLIDGVSQVLLQDFTINGNSNRQDIETFFGLVGFSEGVPKVEITFSAAILNGGPEFDVIAAAKAGTVHEVQVPYGTKSIISQGCFKDFNLGRSTNSPSQIGGSFTGTYEDPK